ncbi:MAG: hypothetical protein Q7T21_03110 [Gallionella sp.]|nr:hypothetical protein [Gallionella sp.]
MAKENSNQTEETVIKGSHFQPYRWANKEVDDDSVMIPGPEYADLASKVNEISQGISVILEMIEISMLERGGDKKPLLSPHAEGALLRLAIRSADMLTEQSEDGMQWAYSQHTKAGRKERASK